MDAYDPDGHWSALVFPPKRARKTFVILQVVVDVFDADGFRDCALATTHPVQYLAALARFFIRYDAV